MTKDQITAGTYAYLVANDPLFVAASDPTDMTIVARRIHEYFWAAYPTIRTLGDIANRGYIVDLICVYLRAQLTDFALVKPYHGELDRYSKKASIHDDNFPAIVNLATPFALVVSKNREVVDNKPRTLRVKHEISIYIGDANPNDFSTTVAPNIFTLMKQCLTAMNAQRIVQGAGEIVTVSDGEYIATTPLFTVYDMKFYQLETIF